MKFLEGAGTPTMNNYNSYHLLSITCQSLFQELVTRQYFFKIN